VERSSRFLMLLDLVGGFSADALNAALTFRLASLPAGGRPAEGVTFTVLP
jgi:hypothetical protein